MRRWAAAVLAVAGLLLIVGTFVPFVRSGPCCMSLRPDDSILFERDAGWSFLVAGWLCAIAGAIGWWLRDPPRWLGVAALVPAAWASLVIWAEFDPAVLAAYDYEFLPGRFLLYAAAILAVVSTLVIVAAPRRHRTPSPSVVGSS